MKQVLRPTRGMPAVREVPSPPCPVGGVLVRTAFSVLSSGTEGAAIASSQQSLAARARRRPDLVRAVVTRALAEGISATRTAINDKLSAETAIGYSSAGRVIEVGELVSNLSPGDLVACAGAGHANHAEIVSVPANLCARVPEGVSPKAAALTTLASIALHGTRIAGVAIGDRVAVVGCGLVGQLTCRLVRCAGAAAYALDLDRDRCEFARLAGAAHAFAADASAARNVLEATGGVGVDHVIVCAASGSNSPMLLAAEIARDRGNLILVGDVPIDLPRAPLYRKELTLQVARSYGPGRYDLDYEERGLDYPIGYVRWTEQRNMEAILALQARGHLVVEDLVSEVYDAERAPEAFGRLVAQPPNRPLGAVALSYERAGSTDEVARLSEVPARAVTAPHLSDPKSLGRVSVSAPNRPVRLGLIGPGAFASRVLVPAFTAEGATLEVVGGGRGPSALAARKLGFRRVADSEEELISAADVDAVVITTRHGSHARLCQMALAAGKHVFCEKPLALTLDELTLTLEVASRADRILAVGFNRRFAPLFVRLREFLRGASNGPITATFRVSAGQVSPEHWVHDLAEGGGRMLGEGCHFVDTLIALTGARLSSVHAVGHGHPGLAVQARDKVVVNFGFTDGSVGSLAYVGHGSPLLPKERLEAFSGGRTAVLDDFRSLELHGPRQSERIKGRAQDKGHRAEARHFLHAVRSGQPPVPLAEVANASAGTLAIVESLRTGAALQLSA